MPIAFVGEVGQATAFGGHSGTSVTVPPSGVGSGHSILIAVVDDNANGAESPSATDSADNPYTVDRTMNDALSLRLTILSAHDVTPLAEGDSIAISLPGGSSFSVAVALEFSGLAASPLDRTIANGGESEAVSTGTTAATQQADELAFAVFGIFGSPAEGLTAAEGWTELDAAAVASYGLYPVYQVLSETGAQEATGTFDTSVVYTAALVTYRAGEPAGDNQTMGDPTSWRGFAGVAIEGTPATAVKSLYKLDLLSESLRGTGEPIELDTIVESRMVEKVVMGPYEAAGDLVYNVTPDIATTLLYTVLTSLSSVGSGDPYVHTFKTGSTLKSLTAQILRDDFYFVYAGLYPSKISFRASAEEVLQATYSAGGRAKERIYDTHQSDAGVVYSTAEPFVFHQASVELHGGAFTESMNWVIDIDTGLLRKRNLGGGRAHNRAYAGKSRVTGSFDLIFDSIEAHRRWMGASSSSYPIDVGDTVQYFAAHVLYTAASGRTIKFEFPKMFYKASSPELKVGDVVMQPCTWGTKRDSSSGSDIVVTVTNGEAPAAITTAGTNI